MADLGRLIALLAGGAGGFAHALDDERERQRVAAIDAANEREREAGRQDRAYARRADAARTEMEAGQLGFVRQPSGATRALELLGAASGDAPAPAFVPGVNAGMLLAGRQVGEARQRAGTVRIPQPDGQPDAALTYDPTADRQLQRDAREREATTARDAAEAQRRMAELLLGGQQRQAENRAQYGYRVGEIRAQGEEARKTQQEKPPTATGGTAAARLAMPSEGERNAAALLPEIMEGRKFLDGFDDPSVRTRLTQGKPILGIWGTSPEGKRFNQAVEQYINNVKYAKTGKAATREEMDALKLALIQQPNDDEDTIARKRQARDLFERGAYIAAGRAMPDVDKAMEGTGVGRVTERAPGGDRPRTQPVDDPHGEADDYAAAAAAYKADLARGTPPAKARAAYDEMVRRIAAAHRRAP